MNCKRLLTLMLAAVLLGFVSSVSGLEQTAHAQGGEVERITVDELKEMLEKKAPVTILDVRTGSSYDDSTMKIKGALRIAPDEMETRMKEIPRDREIVTYCT